MGALVYVAGRAKPRRGSENHVRTLPGLLATSLSWDVCAAHVDRNQQRARLCAITQKQSHS